MQEIRKYIPQAEYGYHVESGEYPAFYGVRIEFTYNGIRFHVCKIYKENKYRIAADMEHLNMSTATTSKGRATNTKSRAISACSPPRK